MRKLSSTGQVPISSAKLLLGPILTSTRGKQTLIAAGHVSLFPSLSDATFLIIHFSTVLQFTGGLEAHLLEVPRQEFEKILLLRRPGNNINATKAQNLRTFGVPPQFVVPMTNPSVFKRTLTIMAAFISQETAFLLVDHSRLIRMHVTSIDRMWTQDDLSPESKVSINHSWPSYHLLKYESSGGTAFGSHLTLVPTGSVRVS